MTSLAPGFSFFFCQNAYFVCCFCHAILLQQSQETTLASVKQFCPSSHCFSDAGFRMCFSRNLCWTGLAWLEASYPKGRISLECWCLWYFCLLGTHQPTLFFKGKPFQWGPGAGSQDTVPDAALGSASRFIPPLSQEGKSGSGKWGLGLCPAESSALSLLRHL